MARIPRMPAGYQRVNTRIDLGVPNAALMVDPLVRLCVQADWRALAGGSLQSGNLRHEHLHRNGGRRPARFAPGCAKSSAQTAPAISHAPSMCLQTRKTRSMVGDCLLVPGPLQGLPFSVQQLSAGPTRQKVGRLSPNTFLKNARRLGMIFRTLSSTEPGRRPRWNRRVHANKADSAMSSLSGLSLAY